MRRIIIGLAASIVVTALACSDDDKATNGTGSNGPGGNGTSAGTSSGFKTCPGSTESACTDAEMKPYNDCIADKCNTKYSECYGPGFKTGSFSGPCGAFITCAQKCACNDLACIQGCVGSSSSECQACLDKHESCESSCTEPACSSQQGDAGNNGGGATCADLTVCCNALTDANEKSGCLQVAGSGAGDPACAQILTQFKALGRCQ